MKKKNEKIDVQFKCEMQIENFKKAELKAHLEKALPGLSISNILKKPDSIVISSNLQALLLGGFGSTAKAGELQTTEEKLRTENQELSKKEQENQQKIESLASENNKLKEENAIMKTNIVELEKSIKDIKESK